MREFEFCFKMVYSGATLAAVMEKYKGSLDFSRKVRWIFSTGIKTAFTQCRHILKTVKNSTDRPPVHTKTAHFCRQILKTVDFENGTLTDTFWSLVSFRCYIWKIHHCSII